MKFNILTLFPECFLKNNELTGTLSVGLIGKSFNNQWTINLDDLKQYNSHLCRIDERPIGGGPGMILRPDKLGNVLEKYNNSKIYFLSPRGKQFNQQMAEDMLKTDSITFLSGRYETIDQRLIDYYNMEEISIGDYILCGGEVAIQVIMESIIRLLPGVMNNHESGLEESFTNILLEHDQYTKPLIWNNLSVPDILLTGNHQLISNFQWQNSINITYKKRPDIYQKFIFVTILLFITRLFLKVTRVHKFFKQLKKIK